MVDSSQAISEQQQATAGGGVEPIPLEFVFDGSRRNSIAIVLGTSDQAIPPPPSGEQVVEALAAATTSNEARRMTESRESLPLVPSYSRWNPLYWWTSIEENPIEQIEFSIFKCLKKPIQRRFVKIRNNSLKIWTVSMNTEAAASGVESTSGGGGGSGGSGDKTPLVMVHGFCGGVALWAHNLDQLSDSRPLYAFDLLGFGRSSRPPFSADPIVAEAQFVESIEDWRKELGLERMILLGHSFGGYLIASYALKYPQHVQSLVLVDPWGFPELTLQQRTDTPMPMWVRFIAAASQYVSPLSIFRAAGQVGVKLFKRLRPDFNRKYMTILDNPDIIYDYLYHANCLNPSGEAGFRAIAEYFGFAKNPMIKRIDKVDRDIPIWFIYGSRSWVDCSPGFSASLLRREFAPVSVKLIIGAGHHVYADKPDEFNEYLKNVLQTIDNFEVVANEDEFYENESDENNTSMSLS